MRAQPKNEDELKKQADTYFENEEYNTAYKFYAQLVSNYPKDPEYNYRLGVCMLYTEPDKKKPYSYLKIATASPKEAPKDALFYLAKTYHINYRFDDALKLYNDYLKIGSASSIKKLQVEREIEACKNGKRLLANLSDLVVVSKKQLNEADYFRSYDVANIGGKLLVKPDEFRTEFDKKKKEKSVIYLPKNGERIYYSSYGENGAKGRDIYFVNKLPNGSWSKPQPMPAPINTDYDEDYPFLHPNGKILYFSSKGHNSMGGYDVFKTTYNDQTQTWGKPVNLDFPINSPDDDILFITDSLEKSAYFSTGRYSPYGKIDVLKINTERRPMNFAVLKGTVVKEEVSQSLKSKITVKNIANGEIVGTYQAQDNGDYYMDLPNGGRFIFTVETPGIATQSEGVTIPIAYTLKPYKQIISYDKKILKIINYFDSSSPYDNYTMMIDLIEKKAKLEMNENDPLNNGVKEVNQNNGGGMDASNVNSVSTTNPTVQGDNGTQKNNNTNKNVTNEQLLTMAKEDAKEATDEAIKLKKEAQDAFGLATQKTAEATQKQKEADDAIAKANTINEINTKNEELKKAKDLQNEAKVANDVANTATNMAKKLEVDANLQQKEADLTNEYIKEIEAVNKNKNNKEALTKLEQIQKQLDDLSKQKNQSDELFNSLKAESTLKQTELQNSEKKGKDIQNEITTINNEVKELEKDLANETDASLKENINAQIRELNVDITSKNKDLATNTQKINGLKNELDGVNKELLIAAKMLNEKTDNIAINNGNKSSGDYTDGAVTTNTNTSNTNATSLSYTGISDKYQDKVNKSVITSTNKEELTNQVSILKNYNQELSNLLAIDKNELSKTKDANEKKKLSDELKKLDKQKIDNDKLLSSINTQIKKVDANTIASSTNTSTSTSNETAIASNTNTSSANETAISTNTVTSATNSNIENQSSGVTTNSSTAVNTNSANNTEFLNQLNTIKKSLNENLSSSGQLFAFNDYKETTSIGLKKTATAKYDAVKQNEDNLNTLVTNAENFIKTYTNNSASGLLAEADALNEKAMQQRKESVTKSGTEKENLLKQVIDNEKLALDKKLQASLLLEQENKKQFEINVINLDELKKLTGTKTNNDISQALMYMDEAVINFKQAKNLREEANNYPNGSAKLGGLNNAEEKENEALVKQQRALDVLSKANPNYQLKTIDKVSNPNEAIANVNSEIEKSTKNLVDAYLALSKTNQNELKLQGDKVIKNPKFKNTNQKEAQDLKAASDDLNSDALTILKQAEQTTNSQDKAKFLQQANQKEIEAIKELNKVAELLKGNAIAATNTNIVSNNGGNGNSNNINNTNPASSNISATTNSATVNTNDIDNQNTTANNSNTNTNTTNILTPNNSSETNTTSINSNTITSVNTNSVNTTNQNDNSAANTNTLSTNSNTATSVDSNSLNTSGTNTQNENTSNSSLSVSTTPNSNTVTTNDNTNQTSNSASIAGNGIGNDVSKLKNELNNPNENNLTQFNAYTNTSAIDLKTKANEKITLALNEDKNISTTLDNIKKEDAQNPSSGSLSQQSINALLTEAEKLNDEAFALRKSAATKTGIDKDKDVNEAKNLESKALATKITAAKQQQQLNEATYEANKQSLKELAELAKGKNIAELNSINTPLNEAEVLKKQATNLREEANAYATDAAKLGGYGNAEEKENASLQKQQEVLTLYKKYFSNYVPKEPSIGSENPVLVSKLNETKVTINTNNQTHIDGLTLLAQANEKEYKARFLALPSTLTNNQASIKTKAQAAYKKSQELITKANQTTDVDAKKNNLIEANTFGQEAITLLNQISSGTNASANTNGNQNTNNGGSSNNGIANNGTSNGSSNGNQIVGGTNNNGTNNTNTGATNNSNTNNTLNQNKNTVKIKVEGLEVKNNNAYSATKPIPIDEKMPDGLVFKVQIGAFKQKLPDNQFKGLSPVVGQTTPNGYIRYMAGEFQKYESANAVKNDLNNLGYNDAFIVAYYNGVRIDLNEAGIKAKAAGNSTEIKPNNILSAGLTNNANVPKNTIAPISTTDKVDIKGELEKMNGLLYTVQIGVYSKQVTRNQLSNLTPIYTEQLPSGLYRYTAGIYNQTDKLIEDKRKVVELGVKDAFVSSYYNGKKITYADGKKLQQENNNLKMETQNPIIFNGAQTTNNTTTQSNITPANIITNSAINTTTVSAFTNGVTTGPAPTADNGVKTDDVGISYKVQIGAYRYQVPNDVASKFMAIKSWPITSVQINGLYIYTFGNFNSVGFAKKLRDEAISLGITDAYITVYKDGKKLYGTEATQYLNK